MAYWVDITINGRTSPTGPYDLESTADSVVSKATADGYSAGAPYESESPTEAPVVDMIVASQEGDIKIWSDGTHELVS